MIQQGFVLMITGMSMVFIFLLLMICSMNVLARLVKMLGAGKQPPAAAPPKADMSKEAVAIAVASQFKK